MRIASSPSHALAAHTPSALTPSSPSPPRPRRPPQDLRDNAANKALFFVAISVGGFVVAFAQSALFTVVGERLTFRVRRAAFKALLKQDIAFFDFPEHSVGALSTYLSSDAFHIRNAAGPNLASQFQNFTTLAFGVGIAFAASWKLALVVFAVVPLMAVSAVIQMKVRHP